MLPIGLIITFCRVCHQCEFCDGRRLEQRPNPEFDPERGVDSGNRPSRAERVSTQLEETVFCADGIGTENVDKSARDTNLCECVGTRNIAEAMNSGTGSAARSSFPAGVRGSRSSRITALGTEARGSTADTASRTDSADTASVVVT